MLSATNGAVNFNTYNAGTKLQVLQVRQDQFGRSFFIAINCKFGSYLLFFVELTLLVSVVLKISEIDEKGMNYHLD